MDSGSTSYCVYSPGNISPSRPPLRRAAPEQARSGFPFLIGMAALVLAVGVGSVARFCPQDLRFDSGGKYPAKPTEPATTAPAQVAAPPVIMPTTFTTLGSPAEAAPAPAPPAPAKKKNARTTRRATTPASSSSAAASATPALPDNPYPQASPPETYGF